MHELLRQKQYKTRSEDHEESHFFLSCGSTLIKSSSTFDHWLSVCASSTGLLKVFLPFLNWLGLSDDPCLMLFSLNWNWKGRHPLLRPPPAITWILHAWRRRRCAACEIDISLFSFAVNFVWIGIDYHFIPSTLSIFFHTAMGDEERS